MGMKKKNWKTWILAAALSLGNFSLCFGADGTWMDLGDGGWSYQRANGSMARGSWEDIDGEWYYFGPDERMATGWQEISNIRYHFEPDGRLTEGWKCYGDGENGQWHYYDSAGNAVIGWFEDGGDWYWFSPEGILNQESSKTIGGKEYWFLPDGRLLSNRYEGIHYYNSLGQPDPSYDVRVWNEQGETITLSDGEEKALEEALNRLPSGWLKTFVDGDWHFVYCPDRGAYQELSDGAGGSYPVHYELNDAERTLYVSSPEGILDGFGAFLYLRSAQDRKAYQYPGILRHREYFILELTGIPQSHKRDESLVFGALFAAYLDEEGRAYMEEEMNDMAWLIGTIIDSRAADGTRK